jgi:DNA-binding Lrp family transcriptional regulator
MKNVKLDRIDLKILQELQKDGRITNIDLAHKVGLSAPPCLRRVRALEREGFIRGYHADIAGEKMGVGITVFSMVSLARHSEADIAAFEKMVEGVSQIRQCFLLTGECDFLLKIVADDWGAFQKFMASFMAASNNIEHVKSMPVMRRSKFEIGIPIEDESFGA